MSNKFNFKYTVAEFSTGEKGGIAHDEATGLLAIITTKNSVHFNFMKYNIEFDQAATEQMVLDGWFKLI